jgi:hypothetical protein
MVAAADQLLGGTMSNTPPPDPWGQQPDPSGHQPDPSAQQQPPWDPQPNPHQQYGYPGGLPPYPGQQPGPYGYPGYSGGPRFDPADPLVSNDYAGWWRRGIAIVKAGWRQLLLLQVIIAAPLLLLSLPANAYAALRQRDFERSFQIDVNTSEDALPIEPATILAFVGMLVALVIISVLWSAIGLLATTRMVVVIAIGHRPTVGDAVRAALGRVLPCIGWYLVAGLISVAALVACFLPIFYVSAVFVILPAVVFFERGNAIGRCFQLFHADIGAALGRILTIAGLSIAAAVVSASIGAAFAMVIQGSSFFVTSATASDATIITSSVVETVLSTAAALFIGVVLTPLIVATYADLRARREPFTTSYLFNS